MIYLDTSVALAHILAEDCEPPASVWEEPLVFSRLLEYEMWTRINARGLGPSHGEMVRALLPAWPCSSLRRRCWRKLEP